MDRLIDEIVKVSVEDALAAAESTSVDTVAVIGVAEQPDGIDPKYVGINVEYSQDDVKKHYSGDLVSITETFFRENNPGQIVCIPTEEITEENVVSSLEDALGKGRDGSGRVIDFYHVIIRLGKDSLEAGVKGSDTAANVAERIIRAVDDWCDENFRIAHVEIDDKDVAHDLCVLLAEKLPKRVSAFSHSESNHRSLAAAIVANRCAADPARGTWAHKSLKSVTSDPVSKSFFKDAKSVGLNVYAKVAGVDRLFFGSIAGTDSAFIDEVIKKDWLKFRVQEAIFNALGSANNGDGVDFDDDGIAAIVGEINHVFVIASDDEHRYVMPDSYEVTAPKYKDISAEDRNVRNMPKVKATFEIQRSIHTVKTVELQVVA